MSSLQIPPTLNNNNENLMFTMSSNTYTYNNNNNNKNNNNSINQNPIDYSKYMIGKNHKKRLKRNNNNNNNFLYFILYYLDVICKFLESFRSLCNFTEEISYSDLRHFIKSILHQSKISYSTVSTGLLYLLWCKQALRKSNNNRINFTAISVTQLFVTSQILSSKYLNDRNASNSAWSKISGICLENLNRMEMMLLSVIEYRLHVEVDLFNRWINFLFQPTKLNNYFSSDFMERQRQRHNHNHNHNHNTNTNSTTIIKRTRLL